MLEAYSALGFELASHLGEGDIVRYGKGDNVGFSEQRAHEAATAAAGGGLGGGGLGGGSGGGGGGGGGGGLVGRSWLPRGSSHSSKA